MRDNGPQKSIDSLPSLSFLNDEKENIPAVDLRRESLPVKPDNDVSSVFGAVEFVSHVGEFEGDVPQGNDKAPEKNQKPPEKNQKPPRDVSFDRDALEKLGGEVADFVRSAGIKRASLVRHEGRDNLVIEFDSRKEVKKTNGIALGDGITADISQNTDGSTHIGLNGAPGCRGLKIANKVVAKVNVGKDGTIELSDITGLKAEVDPGNGLPWIWANLNKVILKPNGDNDPTLEVTGGLLGIKHTESFSIPKDQGDKLRELIAKIEQGRRSDDKNIAVQGPASDLVKPAAEDDGWLKYLPEALTATALTAFLARMLSQGATRLSTAPREAAVIDGRVLPRHGEFFVDATGRIRTQSELKPDIENVVTVRSDAEGKLHLRILKEGTQVHIRSADGDIRTVTSTAEVELKPGETFSTGRAEFARISTGRIPSHSLRLVSAGNAGAIDIPLVIQDNQTFEIGKGEANGKVDRPGLAGRVEMNIEGVSARQARFGMDSKGLFITEGGVPPGSSEVAPSEQGTFVNGERLRAGEKRYLKPADRITFGEPGAKALARITIEPIGIKDGERAPAHLRNPEKTSALRSIEGTSMGEPFKFTIGAERQITIGKEGHLDVGGKLLANKHAQIRVDHQGNAFMRVLPQTGAPDATAYIERHGGGNVQLTAEDGWVPLGSRDQISLGGSKFFSLTERVASPYSVTVVGKRMSLSAGEHFTIGRNPDHHAADGTERIAIDNPGISKTHARVGVDAKGNLYVEDVGTDGKGSLNGTFVNGKRLKPGEKCHISDTDSVWLGKPSTAGAIRIDVRDLISKGDKVLGGRVLSEQKIERPARMEPRANLPIRGVDIPIPTETRGSTVVGEIKGQTVRIRGGVPDGLPHESINLSPADVKALGTEKSQFEKVELTIRGEKVAYYRPKNNGNRFYLLAENGREGPKLIRDYEVYLQPPSGGSATPGAPKDGPGSGGTGNGGASKPPGEGPGSGSSSKPPGERPGTGGNEPGGSRPPGGPKPDNVAGSGKTRGEAPGSGGNPPGSSKPPGVQPEGGPRPEPAGNELRIETSPFESGPNNGGNLERPVGAMEQGKFVEIRLPGQVVARVSKAELPKYLERVERDMKLDELGKIFEAQANDKSLPKEEQTKWEKLNERYKALTPQEKADCKADLFAQIRTDLGVGAATMPEREGHGSRAAKCLGIAGAGLGIAIISGVILHSLLKSEQKSGSSNRIQVEFKR